MPDRTARRDVPPLTMSFRSHCIPIWLQPVGYRTRGVSGMLGGPNLLRRPQFKVALTGRQQRVRVGVEGLRRLRRDAGKRLRELGFDDHFFKPFRHIRMRAMLNRQQPQPVPAGPQDSSAAGAQPLTLDPAALGRLAELDPKGENRLLERVLRAFQSSVARLRPQLDAARRSGDRAAIKLVAHTLKSSSASIGAMQLSQWCAQVEATVRDDEAADLTAPLVALDAALDAALQAIDALLKERA